MKITVEKELLVEAFAALEGELHHPEENSECPQCKVMWDIEQAIGERLMEDRGDNDIVAICSVRPVNNPKK